MRQESRSTLLQILSLLGIISAQVLICLSLLLTFIFFHPLLAGFLFCLTGFIVVVVWRRISRDDFSGWFTWMIVIESLFISIFYGVVLTLTVDKSASSVPLYVLVSIEGSFSALVLVISFFLAIFTAILKRYRFALAASYLAIATFLLRTLMSFIAGDVY